MKNPLFVSRYSVSHRRRKKENSFITKLVTITAIISAFLITVAVVLISSMPKGEVLKALKPENEPKEEIITACIYPEPTEDVRAKANRLREIRYEDYLTHVYEPLEAEMDNVYIYDYTKKCYLTFDDGPSSVTPQILDVLEKGYIPVIATVGCDDEGHTYNINADTAAASIAGKLKAESLISMTDIAGILRDKDDPTTLIPKITTKQAKELFLDGTISGGMIPKVECCLEAIERGVKKVFIMDGRIPHSLLIETLTDEGAGTMVTGD